MTRRQKLLLILYFVGLPIAGLAAPHFVVNDGFRDRPIDVSFPELDPYQRVRACQAQFEETASFVEAAQRELNRAQSILAAAERDEEQLPLRISELKSRLRELDTELDRYRNTLATAEVTYSELATIAPQRIAHFRGEAEERHNSELEDAFHEIDEARRQRDELRRQRGHAHTIGGPDEAILARQKKRQATEQAAAGLAWEIGQFEAEVNGEVDAAGERVQTYERLIIDAQFAYSESESELATSRARLASLPETIEQAYSRVAAAEIQLSALSDSYQLHEDALALAQSDLNEQQRVQATERERTRQARAVSVSSTRSSSSSYNSSTPAPFSTTRNEPATGSDRRFDPSYRPSVGEHYVDGYYRHDGTYVRGHWRTDPDDSFWNNYSSSGNVNPHTGQIGSRIP